MRKELSAGLDFTRIIACFMVVVLHVSATGVAAFGHDWAPEAAAPPLKQVAPAPTAAEPVKPVKPARPNAPAPAADDDLPPWHQENDAGFSNAGALG